MTNIKNLLLLFVFTLCISCAYAKIWRVNNNTGVVADFTTFAAAVSSASVLSGDTIHIEPSATSYGGATMSKRLVVIGIGYLLNPLPLATQVRNYQYTCWLNTLDGANVPGFRVYLENTVHISVSAPLF